MISRGTTGVPPGKAECLWWSAGWGRGVMMVMDDCGMILGGANPDEGPPIQWSSSSMLSTAEKEGGKESGMI
jgi:hypothetical protein